MTAEVVAAIEPGPFSWRGILFAWRQPFGSQSAQYEGSVSEGGRSLWFALKPVGIYWQATCGSPLGCLSYPRVRPTKEEALDVALQDARAAIAQTSGLLGLVSP